MEQNKIVPNKLRNIMVKYGLLNILKTLAIIISLFLIARLLIPTFTTKTDDMIYLKNNVDVNNVEGFETLGYTYYGNQLSLQDPTNKPQYAGNKCYFKFDNVYRLEGLSVVFNNNLNKTGLPNPSNVFSSTDIKNITIQYEDSNGNLKFIKSSTNSSPPNFANTEDLRVETIIDNNNNNLVSSITIKDITDENNMVVYTSRVIISVGKNDNSIDRYIDENGNSYISNFGFWGSTRDMLARKDYESLAPTLSTRQFAYNGTSYDDKTNMDTYTFTNVTDLLLYGLSMNYEIETMSGTGSSNMDRRKVKGFNTTDNPFKLSIMYNNGIYTGNNFNINSKYIIRSDSNKLMSGNGNNNNTYIIFSQPIIANKVMITLPRVKTLIQNEILKCILSNLKGYGNIPNQKDISDYQKTINALLSSSNKEQILDVCPSVDNLIVKQNQAQQICDNLEYQDKIKSEKLRLEKNKQYLLKLKQQQDEIDQLNSVITSLDSKRQTRMTSSDMARVAQYQHQRQIASTVRDIANQRLQSQNNNQLYMDININPITP